VSGTNNVSVEIHQYDKNSPDISFKLNLAALQAFNAMFPQDLTLPISLPILPHSTGQQ
jgi:hypothetical protein